MRQWRLIVDLLPRRGGGRWQDDLQVADGLLWKLCTGTHCRDLPVRSGPWQTIYHRGARWRSEGIFDGVLDRLRLRLDAEGVIDLDTRCMDGPSGRASRSVADVQKPLQASRRITRSAGSTAAASPAFAPGERSQPVWGRAALSASGAC